MTTQKDQVSKKNKHYKAINVSSANSTKLSLKAKGLMFYLLSKPDGWRGQVYDIVKNTSCGKSAVQSALKELTEHKYVELIRERNVEGQITSYYKIYDQPKRSLANTIILKGNIVTTI